MTGPELFVITEFHCILFYKHKKTKRQIFNCPRKHLGQKTSEKIPNILGHNMSKTIYLLKIVNCNIDLKILSLHCIEASCRYLTFKVNFHRQPFLNGLTETFSRGRQKFSGGGRGKNLLLV
jgi:hypothetical protein